MKLFTFLLAALFLLTGCSGEASRPSVAQLETSLWKEAKAAQLDTKQSVVHCQAVALQKSSLSDAGLRAFVGDSKYELTSSEARALSEGGPVWVRLRACQQNI